MASSKLLIIALITLLATPWIACSDSSSARDTDAAVADGSLDQAARDLGADASDGTLSDQRADITPDLSRPTRRKVAWAAAFGSEGLDGARAVAVDGAGNVYVTGYFSGSVDFGDGATTANADDIFLVSLDPRGTLRWAKHFGGDEDDGGRGLAVDAANNIYLVATFRGSADFGDGALAAAGDKDIVAASFEQSGDLRWVTRLGGEAEDDGAAIAVIADGQAYIAGAIKGEATIGSETLSPEGTDALFVALDASGAPRWAKAFGGSGIDQARAVATDGQGAIYLGGEFSSRADFAGTELVAFNQADAFVARFDAAGALSWAKAYGGDGWDNVRGMAVDREGNLFLTGTFYGSVDFGGGPHEVVGSSDVFEASLKSDASFRWSATYGGVAAEQGRAVAVDQGGFAHFVGEFRDMIDFGGGTVGANGTRGDVFLSSTASLGDYLYAAGFGGEGSDYCYSVAAAPDGSLYLTGTFAETVDFGGHSIVSAGSADIFVTKLVVE